MTMRTTMDEWQLLQAYAKDRSETAFAELVRRHLDWVYSAALRHVGDPNLAEDVVQSVFVVLARKAGALGSGIHLGGWLFRTTRHVAAHARRAEQRRKTREATACTMSHDIASPDTDEILWQRLAPHLDQAVAALSEADRSAILMRFYEKMPLRKIGERLGVSEEAAKKRVGRAVEKMREFLDRRGVRFGAAILATILLEKTVQTASAALAGAVVKVSVAASSASGSAMLPQLARETIRAWRWAKVQLTAGLAAGSLVLVFLALNAGGLLSRHATSPALALNGPPGADTGAVAQAQDAQEMNAGVVAGVNNPIPAARKTGAITGLVLDANGSPIPGATVWGGFGQQPFALDITDRAGQFALARIAAPPFVTVTVDGFAADQQEFDPAKAPEPLVFRLSPAPALLVRLVDESGQGVAGVKPFLYQWWGRVGTIDHLSQQSDLDGLWRWLSPPKGELEVQFMKAGYRVSRANKLTANGDEHTIVLRPTVPVTGRVVDAETSTPLPSFRLTLGHSQPWSPDSPLPMWDNRSQPGSSGFYQTVIEEEQVPFLRVEADGYETVETVLQLTNGVDAVRDFELRRNSAANSIRGRVLLSDGSPAAGIEVALCTAQAGVMLSGTTFEPGAFGNLNRSQRKDYRRRTDAQGSFSFEPKPGAHTVVAAGPAGLGQMRCLDSSRPLEIRLQPWGRVEGTVRTRDGRWADRKIQWRRNGNLTSWMTLFYDAKGYSTGSDEAGKFTLEHVPPGDGRVAIDDGTGIGSILSDSLQVNPGETVQVQIGGVGRMVTGKLVAPPNLVIRSWSRQVNHAQVQSEWDPYPLPKELTGNAIERWKLEFEDSEAGRTWFRDQRSYDFKVGTDGSFAIPEVLPGNYRLFVSVAQGSLGSGPDLTERPPDPSAPQIAWAGMKITVPDASQDGGAPIDLGSVVLTPTR